MSQTKYKQLHLYSDTDHKPQQATAPPVEPPPAEQNRITGLIARQSQQVKAMRLGWVRAGVDVRFQRIEEGQR